ncbi:MAG: type I glyceraldehyde-3-phosphate dehydrogenase, partial [Candidatus Micrarchaeota archaeon]
DLFTYDSVHGRWPGKVKINGPHSFTVDGTEIHTLEERDPSKLPWKKLDVDLVFDCTGVFRTKEKLQPHIDAGAGKVLLSAPPKDDMKQFVKGINDDHYQGEEIVSMASCTTNCLAPMVKVLLDDFGFKRGFMTTVHAYTNDQVVLDSSHKDLRRARAAAVNIVPTTTGATKATGVVIPEVKGKITGMCLRVPVADGSITDLTAELGKQVTVDDLNNAFRKAAAGHFKGIIEYTQDPIVSSDIIGNEHSCILDGQATMVLGDKSDFVKVLGWYDNEWGYSVRMLEFADLMLRK